jgi:hypothetical protein
MEVHAVDQGRGEERPVEPTGTRAGQDIDPDVVEAGGLEKRTVEPDARAVPVRRSGLHPAREPQRFELGTRTADPHGEADATPHAERQPQLALRRSLVARAAGACDVPGGSFLIGHVASSRTRGGDVRSCVGGRGGGATPRYRLRPATNRLVESAYGRFHPGDKAP